MNENYNNDNIMRLKVLGKTDENNLEEAVVNFEEKLELLIKGLARNARLISDETLKRMLKSFEKVKKFEKDKISELLMLKVSDAVEVIKNVQKIRLEAKRQEKDFYDKQPRVQNYREVKASLIRVEKELKEAMNEGEEIDKGLSYMEEIGDSYSWHYKLTFGLWKNDHDRWLDWGDHKKREKIREDLEKDSGFKSSDLKKLLKQAKEESVEKLKNLSRDLREAEKLLRNSRHKVKKLKNSEEYKKGVKNVWDGANEAVDQEVKNLVRDGSDSVRTGTQNQVNISDLGTDSSDGDGPDLLSIHIIKLKSIFQKFLEFAQFLCMTADEVLGSVNRNQLNYLECRLYSLEVSLAEINAQMNGMHADLTIELRKVNLENRKNMKRHFEKYDSFIAQLSHRQNIIIKLYDYIQAKIEELKNNDDQSGKVAKLERKLAPIAAEYRASIRTQRQIENIKKNPKLALFYTHIQKYIMGYLLGNVAVNSGEVEGVDSAEIQALSVGEDFFEKAAGLFGLGTWGEIVGKVLFAGGRKYLEHVQDQERENVANLAANLMEMGEIIERTARKLTRRNGEILGACVSDVDVERLAIAAAARLRISMNKDDLQNTNIKQKINQLVSAVEKPITTLKGHAQQFLCRILNKCYIQIETVEHGVSSMFQEDVFTKCSLKCRVDSGKMQEYLPVPQQASGQELKNAFDYASRIGSRFVRREEVVGKINLKSARKRLRQQKNASAVDGHRSTSRKSHDNFSGRVEARVGFARE